MVHLSSLPPPFLAFLSLSLLHSAIVGCSSKDFSGLDTACPSNFALPFVRISSYSQVHGMDSPTAELYFLSAPPGRRDECLILFYGTLCVLQLSDSILAHFSPFTT